MKTKLILPSCLLALILLGCWPLDTLLPGPSRMTTPPPGWRSLVSDLLLDDNAFPTGWARERDFPKGSLSDPTINHVYRRWWGEARGSGSGDQAIWRAYTISDAEEKFAGLRQSQFHPSRTLSPYTTFLEFQPPDEIDFQSSTADEYYLACGWWRFAYCEVIARYRNYVVELSLNLEAEYEGHVTDGLTYPEIEAVVRAMDAKFVGAMAEWYPETP